MVNYNGDLLPETSHFLNHSNRGLVFGDALTERLRYTGHSIPFLEEHYFRLLASMRQLRMEIPMAFTMEYLEEEISKTLVASGHSGSPAMIRVLVFRNDGPDLVPDTLEVSYIIESVPTDGAGFEFPEGEFRADLFRDYFIVADALARISHTNRMTRVLAGIYARENDLDTCLLLNHRKEVAEGLHGTLFLRKGATIKTPPLASGCTDGILRKHLLRRSWEDSPFSLVEEVISPFELQQADELFLTDLAIGVRPVTRYKKAVYSTEAARYVAEVLNEGIGAAP